MHRPGGNGTWQPEPGHTDPDYAPTAEVFDNLTHADIQRGVLELNPEVLTAGRQVWQQSASGVSEAVQSAHTEIRGAIADGWRGGAAQLAAGAVTAFEQLGQQLSDVMGVVGDRLAQANDAAETLRASVSQQVDQAPNLEAALLDPKQAAANAALQKAAENLRQDTVRVMESVYTGVFLASGNSVPAFPEGGMYPNIAPPEPGAPVPGDGRTDLAGDPARLIPTAATESGPGVQQPVAVPGSGERSDDPPPADRPTADESSAQEPAVAPAAVAAPTLPEPARFVAAPGATVAAAVAPETPAMPAANQVVPPSNTASAPAVAAATPVAPAGPVAPPPVSPAAAPSTSPAAAATTAASSGPASNSQSTEPGKQDERDDRASGADSISGMGAGVMGGLAGGVFAAGDAVRQGSSQVPKQPVRTDDEFDEFGDEDEDYYLDFDEPTFLEPAEPGGALIGQLDPTTPPVLGEWSDES
ncbi:PPE domain-containing protein [Nocardia vermiculata]|uniref:PPE domain-containing protein n=1 Tax=Nocardia vermiculata TaxID=257274 RepID=A0A846XTK9_9NOCA|nr:hypothetical protein [Nocardia vermiculata]NKY49104.1 hypothetical protein [Nocardia vermiculata]